VRLERFGFTIILSLFLTALGSIVQKGKFSAGIPILVSTLNRVDLPTLGRPTMPI